MILVGRTKLKLGAFNTGSAKMYIQRKNTLMSIAC